MRIAIVGGSGKMGRWLASYLLKDGHQVVITGRNQGRLEEVRKELRDVTVAAVGQAVESADAVVLSVSIDGFEQVVRELAPYTHPKQIILDITSVKAMPVEVMHRHIKQGTVLGTHPVFGPGARDLHHQNIVLTPTNAAETALAERVKSYLETRGASICLMTPEEHDRIVAVTLGLCHYIAVVSADTLLGFDHLNETETVGGNYYKILSMLAQSVVSSEDPEFYAQLQTVLPALPEIEQRFVENARSWSSPVKIKDRQKLIEKMIALRTRLAQAKPDYGETYQKIYRMFEEPDH